MSNEAPDPTHEVRTDIASADWDALARYLYRRPKGTRYAIRQVAICFVIFAALTMLPNWIDHRDLAIGNYLTLVIIAVLGALYLRWWRNFALHNYSKQPGAWIGEYVVAISPDGLAWRGGSSEVKMSWTLIDEIEVLNDGIYFHMRTRQAVRVPMRAFVDPDQRDEFVHAARTYLAAHLPTPLKCPHCGYDLRATTKICPECGWEFRHG
jgi:hypothetical protein